MPLVTTMHRSQLPRSGMALGGIGAGSFEIRQDGGFANWQIFNNWPLFPGPRYPHHPKHTLFFLLRVREENADPRIVLLQIEDSHGAAAIDGHEYHYMFPWLSGVDVIRSTVSFPFAELDYEQDGLPLKVSLRAWSPFIPGNVKDSALPLAVFDFTITSTGDRPIDVQLLATARNVVAYDQPARIYENRRVRDGDFSAVILSAAQTAPTAPTTGELCLASFAADSTAYMGWEHNHPYYERVLREFPLPEVDDTAGRNNLHAATEALRADPRCFVTIGRSATLAARGKRLEHRFALSWHFPNLYGRRILDPGEKVDYHEPNGHDDRPEGHYYAAHFETAEAVARYAHEEGKRLLAETTAFHRAFFDSNLPGFVLDQINSHLNTFRTSTWLTRTGMFGVFEGINPTHAYVGIATTDVAMYGQIATSLLFPELDKLTVDIWSRFQNPDGSVIHSVCCNSHQPDPRQLTAERLDMPAQFAFLALRAGLWSGDRDWLASLWPQVKSALAYVLRERDKNADGLPDMEGVMCSYDNFPMHGVAPYVVTQWLAALAAALHTARLLGDDAFVADYTPRFEAGRATLEKTTWNGRYFNLFSDARPDDPAAHLGCLADQIIGDGAARALGLPPVVDPAKGLTALKSILAMNYRPDQGLRNCQWPGDAFLHPVGPDTWVDQANTCWTGVELLFAAQLYSAGLHESAEEIIRNVDTRHRRWGMYWDHQEFGGHYFRPMSALAIPNAFLGLSYDGETLRIAPARPLPYGRWCMLLPGAFGTFHHTPEGCHLALASGSVRFSTLELPVAGEATPVAGGNFITEIIDHATVLCFTKPFTFTPETPVGMLRS